jgi:hypothetical protein
MFGLPIDEAVRRMQESARELDRAGEKIAAERERMNFGSHIAQAVKRKITAQAQSRTAIRAEGDSFGEKLKRAVEKKRRQREQQSEKERSRYRHLKPRPRRKSE